MLFILKGVAARIPHIASMVSKASSPQAYRARRSLRAKIVIALAGLIMIAMTASVLIHLAMGNVTVWDAPGMWWGALRALLLAAGLVMAYDWLITARRIKLRERKAGRARRVQQREQERAGTVTSHVIVSPEPVLNDVQRQAFAMRFADGSERSFFGPTGWKPSKPRTIDDTIDELNRLRRR